MLVQLLLNAIALYCTSSITPGIKFKGTFPIIAMVVIISLLNIFVRPVLFLLTLPITILSIGLFILILNGIIFLLAASLVKDYEVQNLSAGVLGWIIYSIFSLVLNGVFLKPYLF